MSDHRQQYDHPTSSMKKASQPVAVAAADSRGDQYLSRALSAYFKTDGGDQPALGESGVTSLNDKSYVVLRNVRGVLAVYRIQNSGQLRRLKRPPKELSDD